MEKLKTLKGLRKDRIKYFIKKLESFGCPDTFLKPTARKIALEIEKQDRKEAINWVKHWRKIQHSHHNPVRLSCQPCLRLQGKIEGVMKINNIIEDDLK